MLTSFNLPKDNVLVVQMWLGPKKEVELRPIGTRPRIGHGQEPTLVVPQLEILILGMYV